MGMKNQGCSSQEFSRRRLDGRADAMARFGRLVVGTVLVLGVAGGFALSCSRTVGGGDFEAEARAACEAGCNKRLECHPDDPWNDLPEGLVWESVSDCVESCLGYEPLHTDDKCGWAVIKDKRCDADVSCEAYTTWRNRNEIYEETGTRPTNPCIETHEKKAADCGWN